MPHHFDPESAEQPSMAFPVTDVLTGRSSRSGCNTPSMTLGPTQMSFVIPSGERVDVELTELSGLSFNHPLNANASLTIETHSLLWIDTNGSGSRYSNRSLQVFFANEQLVTHLRNLVEGKDWAHNRPHAVLSAYECGVPSWANPLIRRGLYRPWMRTVVFIASILFIVNTLVLALVDISAVASEVAPLLGIPSGHSRSDQSIQASTDTGPQSQSFAQWRLLAPLGPFVAIGRRVVRSAGAGAAAAERALLNLGLRREVLIRASRGVGALFRALSQSVTRPRIGTRERVQKSAGKRKGE